MQNLQLAWPVAKSAFSKVSFLFFTELTLFL
jgi:hypothetical protein